MPAAIQRFERTRRGIQDIIRRVYTQDDKVGPEGPDFVKVDLILRARLDAALAEVESLDVRRKELLDLGNTRVLITYLKRLNEGIPDHRDPSFVDRLSKLAWLVALSERVPGDLGTGSRPCAGPQSAQLGPLPNLAISEIQNPGRIPWTRDAAQTKLKQHQVQDTDKNGH